jgi:ferredoxin
VRLTITPGQCQGHARCAALVPDIFDLDDEGDSFILPGRDRIPDGNQAAYEQALLAVDSCPEEAIRIEPNG